MKLPINKAITCTIYLIALCMIFPRGEVIANQTGGNATIFVNGLESLRLRCGKEQLEIKDSIELHLEKPVYCSHISGSIEQAFFIYPKEQLTIDFNEAGKVVRVSGSPRVAAVNQYLTGKPLVAPGGGFNIEEESKYLEFVQNKYDQAVVKLLELQLPADFVEFEKLRLSAKVFTFLVTYPSLRKRTDRSYQPSDKYLQFAKEKLVEEDQMMVLQEYRNFLHYLTQLISTAPIKPYSASRFAAAAIRWSLDNFQLPSIRTYLVNHFAFDYLKRNGQNELDEIKSLFDEHVKDPSLIKVFYDKYDVWAKIQPGKPLPTLVFHDNTGKERLLSEFMGKYIYIDVWATWCVPCLAEIPNLNAMKDSLKNAPIEIVSISVDKDKAAWETMVVEDRFQGTQLHSPGRLFSETFSISSIPRFILIGPDGAIVEPNAPRPNRAETYEWLKSLNIRF